MSYKEPRVLLLMQDFAVFDAYRHVSGVVSQCDCHELLIPGVTSFITLDRHHRKRQRQLWQFHGLSVSAIIEKDSVWKFPNDTERRALSLRELSFSCSRLMDALRVVRRTKNCPRAVLSDGIKLWRRPILVSRFCIRHLQGYCVAFCTSLSRRLFIISAQCACVRAAYYGKRCLLNLNGRSSHGF